MSDWRRLAYHFHHDLDVIWLVWGFLICDDYISLLVEILQYSLIRFHPLGQLVYFSATWLLLSLDPWSWPWLFFDAIVHCTMETFAHNSCRVLLLCKWKMFFIIFIFWQSVGPRDRTRTCRTKRWPSPASGSSLKNIREQSTLPINPGKPNQS